MTAVQQGSRSIRSLVDLGEGSGKSSRCGAKPQKDATMTAGLSRWTLSAMGHLRPSCMISADGSLSPVSFRARRILVTEEMGGSNVAGHSSRKLVALQHHRHLSYRSHVRTCNSTHFRAFSTSHLDTSSCL